MTTSRRQRFVRLHRWMGLLIAGYLIIAGVTGSVIAFKDELEVWLNPHLLIVAPPLDQQGKPVPMLDAFVLRERVERALPTLYVGNVVLNPKPSRSVVFRLAPRTNIQAENWKDFTPDEAFVDPYTGKLLGVREWGESPFKRETLITFIYRLHYSLALPAPWGNWLFGGIALIWTLDCFVGFYLTLPRGRPFFEKWKPSWLIKRKRFNFDFHRALSLWLWVMLLVYAWSSVMLNLREVYVPVMSTVFRFDEPFDHITPLPQALEAPAIDWHQAHSIARKTLESVAEQNQAAVLQEIGLRYIRESGVYVFWAHSTLDPGSGGSTGVLIDANNGSLRGAHLPTGHASGNTVSTWLRQLHMAEVFGFPYRIFVALFGIAVAALSVTGLVIWWRKRCARVGQRKKSGKLLFLRSKMHRRLPPT